MGKRKRNPSKPSIIDACRVRGAWKAVQKRNNPPVTKRRIFRLLSTVTPMALLAPESSWPSVGRTMMGLRWGKEGFWNVRRCRGVIFVGSENPSERGRGETVGVTVGGRGLSRRHPAVLRHSSSLGSDPRPLRRLFRSTLSSSASAPTPSSEPATEVEGAGRGGCFKAGGCHSTEGAYITEWRG